VRNRTPAALLVEFVSAGNIVPSTATGSLDVSATTFTYTPYLLIGSRGQDVTRDTIVTGTDYQEYYSNFPLSSQIVTGIFLAGVQTQSLAKTQSHLRLLSQSTVTGASLAAAALPASVTDLGTLSGNSAAAYGINDLGQVVGASDTGRMGGPKSARPRCAISHAFLWEAGSGRKRHLDFDSERKETVLQMPDSILILPYPQQRRVVRTAALQRSRLPFGPCFRYH